MQIQRSYLFIPLPWVICSIAMILAQGGLAQPALPQAGHTEHRMQPRTDETSPRAAPFDASFIDAMIRHHQGAVEMAKQALAEAQRPEIRQLSESILNTQQAEIDRMRAWRTAWYPDLGETSGLHMEMGPMEVAGGDASFDLRFIDAMIPHHQAAIEMARQALLEAEHPELKALAESIIKSQQAEIEQMQIWRTHWAQ